MSSFLVLCVAHALNTPVSSLDVVEREVICGTFSLGYAKISSEKAENTVQ